MIFKQNLIRNSKKEKEIQKEVVLNLSIGHLVLSDDKMYRKTLSNFLKKKLPARNFDFFEKPLHTNKGINGTNICM